MDLSVAIVSWNTRDLLDACLESVYATTGGIEFEVIVVDNASSDGSAEMVRSKYPQVRLVPNAENVGFVKANNQAWPVSSGRHFLLLNPDTICHDSALPTLVRFLDEHPDAGAVGPLVLNPDGTLQYSWAKFPTLWSELVGKLVRRVGPDGLCPKTCEQTRRVGPLAVDWVGGCCMMVRGEAIRQIGLMDELFFMYSEETDWCYRLHQGGWRVWVEPAAQIVHIGGQSTAQSAPASARRLRESKVTFFRKHHGRLAGRLVGMILASKHCLRTRRWA